MCWLSAQGEGAKSEVHNEPCRSAGAPMPDRTKNFEPYFLDVEDCLATKATKNYCSMSITVLTVHKAVLTLMSHLKLPHSVV